MFREPANSTMSIDRRRFFAFDDRLYAAMELAAQHGAGRFTGKATLLRSLAATLATGLTVAADRQAPRA
jgi:hypothetical protein